MKNKIKMILSLVLIMLVLSSCGRISDIQLPALPTATPEGEAMETEPSSVPVPQDTEPEEEPAMPEKTVTVIVSGSDYESAYEAPDGSGETILTFAYYTPVVNIDGNPDASNAVNDYLSSVDEIYYSGSEKYSGINYYYELALDNYSYVKETGKEINTDFYSVRKFTCRRCDGAIISFVYTTYDYLGIASENYSSEAFCFNTSDGSVLQFSDITEDPDALIDACADYLSDTDLVNSDSLYSLAENNGWFLNDEGLNFLAPRYSSLLETEAYCVPFDVVAELIDPLYVSAVSSTDAEASVKLVSSDDLEENSVDIIDIVNIDDVAESTFLVIEGTARDISISMVEYNDSDGSFFITDTLWYCSCLTDSAVQLTIAPPTGIPEIMLSYSAGDGSSYQLLAVEGETAGSIVLSDEDIQPLG